MRRGVLVDEEAPSVGGFDAPTRVLAAGMLRLDTADERLWVAGETTRLGGKALALLRVLMERPQTLVTKDELFARVWPGVTVSESVLTTAVKEVRQAIGDDARRPTMIETVHGRGYRFLLPVTHGDSAEVELARPGNAPPPAPATRGRRLRIGLIALVAVILVAVVVAGAWLAAGRPLPGAPSAHPKSVAVLPFEDLSPGATEQWFADGLTEEVASTLARTSDLRVAAYGSVPAGDGDQVRAAARKVGVAHVLKGSVRRSGDRLRVTADLLRASDGVQVWSQSYDRSVGDIISIQEDIGRSIAQALKTATDPTKLRDMSAAGTRSVAAYEAYLRGLALDRRQLEDGDIEYARAAAAAFEEARRLDPTFAAAQWRSALTWFGNATRVDANMRPDGLSDRERLQAFFERVDAAIRYSPTEADALKYRAARAVMQLKVRRAQQLIGQYVEARPRDLDGWERMADYSAYAGDRAAMVRAARRLHKLSVEVRDPQSRAITVLVMGLRAEEALKVGRRQIKLRPTRTLTYYQTHRAAVWSGRLDEARAYMPRLRSSGLPRENLLLAELRQACADGQLDAAQRLAQELGASSRPASRYHAAQLMGDEAAANRALAPLDTPDRLPTLMQFLIYPTFDARAFPNLSKALAADGSAITPPVRMPYGCGRRA
jgi:TolB-like protein/DNA-binding winged helix-turn-helix (wHTH) protein